MPSEWEGSFLFRENPYCKIITDDKLRFQLNKFTTDESTYQGVHENLKKYNERTKDNVELVYLSDKENIGKKKYSME